MHSYPYGKSDRFVGRSGVSYVNHDNAYRIGSLTREMCQRLKTMDRGVARAIDRWYGTEIHRYLTVDNHGQPCMMLGYNGEPYDVDSLGFPNPAIVTYLRQARAKKGWEVDAAFERCAVAHGLQLIHLFNHYMRSSKAHGQGHLKLVMELGDMVEHTAGGDINHLTVPLFFFEVDPKWKTLSVEYKKTMIDVMDQLIFAFRNGVDVPLSSASFQDFFMDQAAEELKKFRAARVPVAA
jgi:hypothetical protein